MAARAVAAVVVHAGVNDVSADEAAAVSAIDSFEPIDEVDLDESDEDLQAVDIDLQAVLDDEPCYPRKRGPKPTYKPGTRQEQAAREIAAADGSWWMKPGADFTKEAQRMRDQPTKLKVPGESNVVGWSSAF